MANKDFTTEIDAIKGDVSKLREDMKALVEAVGETLEERGEEARARAAERLKAARERGEESLDELGKSIEQHPLTAVLTALGIGFLVGALVSRR
ncbi:MAG: hypothetical protein D6807_09360 [Alphaproteobacteria bacterium]|nr:MAG: hypothetical protein D6807_09360 [Alphaproteobacteria bacterium]